MNLCYLEVLLLVGAISASHIIFTAQPQNVSPVLTPTLHLHCSLKTGELPDADLSPPSSSLMLLHKPPPDILHVVSIIIYKSDNVTRTNKTIASVTPFDPASVETSDTGEAITTGNTQSSASGEHGYLEINKISPNDKDAGTYVCQVSALDYAKYPVSFQASQQITALEPTVADFVHYVEANNKNIAKLNQDIAVLTSTISQLKTEHIQTGLQKCEQTSPDAFIAFPVPFNSTPRVITALTSLSKMRDYFSGYSEISFRTHVTRVNTTGFLFRCEVASTSFSFSWVAIGDQI
ncbi:hypothetical protein BsWGS_16888 [Bradybaena similaris]